MLTGKLLNGRYKMLKMIGGGGMAHVYLAHDQILNREVAVKVLRLDFSDNDEFIERFRREAYSATSLHHPNIVEIFDVGEEDGIYFMVMEYVDGKTLKQLIQQYGPVSVEDSVHIMSQMTSAIQHAHENQIIHRDIKPHNILINEDGVVKITDFGIAMALSSTSITQTNSVLGSVHYFSPEQARGGMANRKSDIYSLGVVMFEILTGRLPFSGESAVSIALKHLQNETPSPRRWNEKIPQSVENIILKATAKDPFHRYASAEEMELDLDTALTPNRINEPKFTLPEEDDDEKTKAIPVVTKMPAESNVDETIVHHSDERKQPKKKNFLWISVFMAILIIGGTTAAFIIPDLFKEEQITIPDMEGKEVSEAITTLRNLGLVVDEKQMIHNEVPEKHVIKTEPSADYTVKKGFPITVYESLGKQKIKFEDYVGQEIEEVKRELQLKGIDVENNLITIEIENEVEQGMIVTQRQPKPGEEIDPDEMKETVVIFEVSEGQKVVIKDMNGWNEQEVQQYIENESLQLEEINYEYSNDVPKGQVISQTINANQKVEKGTTVGVIISKGPSPKTTTITKVIPYNGESLEKVQRIDVYISDIDNKMEEVALSDTMTESKAISFDIQVPYNGEASYKIYVNGEFFEGNIIRYNTLPE
ncbi:Stk1 family PASTA domain-containing Ser/Thr kinase [Bacillus solimangrovi]|uniref:Serine/threonine-protein kinase PrkC n=1 Tax=Bacillus solimangrovi TaxID=1305675 RepID=A0A1E5LAW5_9BACI|nr:Stk1 family PASTA domain-containing Ser/Thr kinase [Bacillus solimangrovi]OEH91216.1 serine/threonine protein kinase [Bacillus solimangrovi]